MRDADLNRKCAEILGWPAEVLDEDCPLPDYASEWNRVPEMLSWLRKDGNIDVTWNRTHCAVLGYGDEPSEICCEELPECLARLVVAVHEAREES